MSCTMDELTATYINELKSVCTKIKEDGKMVETDPELSARIFYKLGQLYASMVDEDVYNYIYSAGLLRASKIRRPNGDVKLRVLQLWRDLLAQAGAVDKKCDLDKVTKDLLIMIADMRKNAIKAVSNIPRVDSNLEVDEKKKIQTVHETSRNISNQFVAIMEKVSSVCVEIMFGDKKLAPSFALCVLGSVARGEATPYSDFEHMILLEDSLSKEDEDFVRLKMRWYTLIFQFIIVNLGETPLRLLGIPCLNNFYTDDESKDWFYDKFTPCGIRFDSNMPFASIHPLSRRETPRKNFKTELIQSASNMIEYLKSDNVVKNGYHLGTVLVKSRFVSGTEALHEKYRELVDKQLRGQTDLILSNIKDCMDNENVLFEMKNKTNSRNIKKICYRGSSVIIGHLGSLFNVSASNTFNIVEQLVQTSNLNNKAGHNLKYIIALSWEVRLRLYLNAKQQVAEIDENAVDPVAELANCIGRKSLFTFCTIWFSFWNVLQPVVLLLESPSSISNSDMRLTDMRTKELWTAYLCPEELDVNRSVENLLDFKQDIRGALLGQVAIALCDEMLYAFEQLILEFDGASRHQEFSLAWIMNKLRLMNDQFKTFKNITPAKTWRCQRLSQQEFSVALFGQPYHSERLLKFHNSFYKCHALLYPYMPTLWAQGPLYLILIYRVCDFRDSVTEMLDNFAGYDYDEENIYKLFEICNEIWQGIDTSIIKLLSLRPSLHLLDRVMLRFVARLVRPDKSYFPISGTKQWLQLLVKKRLQLYHNKILNKRGSNDMVVIKFSLLRLMPSQLLHYYAVDKFSRGFYFIQANIKHCQGFLLYRKRQFDECMNLLIAALMCIREHCANCHFKDFEQIRKVFRLLGVCAFRTRKFRLAREAFKGDLDWSNRPMAVVRSVLREFNS